MYLHNNAIWTSLSSENASHHGVLVALLVDVLVDDLLAGTALITPSTGVYAV